MTLPAYRPFLGEEESDNVAEALQSGWVSTRGGNVEEFEERLREFLGVPFGVATDSGTAALEMALLSQEIEEGDEVLVPDMTFGATARAVKNVGATPVPVDVDPEKMGMDLEELERSVTLATSAILLVHLFGHPEDIRGIEAVAERHGLKVVEDAAHSLGSEFDGEKTGTLGDAGCFSFSWNKTITTGKGGFVALGEEEAYQRVRELSDYGRRDGRWVGEKGRNYTIDNVRASVGVAQMDRLDEMIEEKRSIVERYQEQLKGVKCMSLDVREDSSTAPYLFYIRTPHAASLRRYLDKKGISSRRFYPPLHSQPAFSADGDYPGSETLYQQGLSLPSFPGIEAEEIDTVARHVDEFLQSRDGS